MDNPQTIETLIRLGCFIGIFVTLLTLEYLSPRRVRLVPRSRRWPSNLGISAFNQLVVRLILPLSTVAFAVMVEEKQWGLFNLIDWPVGVEILAAILLLDLAIYLQHLVYHAIPVLWRFHRMHHADVEFDVTTGIRFHPISVLFSAIIKLAAVYVIGPAAMAVLIFEILLNAISLFNHSNIRVPSTIEPLLRWIVVTPDMHRVHHSSNPLETNSNFGFNFPLWDRLFRTYRAQPALGHTDMVVGLDEFREAPELRLDAMLTQPFRRSKKVPISPSP